MRMCNRLVALTCLFALVGSSASADVEEWNLVKLRTGQQTTDDTAPSGPFVYEVFSELFTDDASDFTDATLSGPGVSTPLNNFAGGPTWSFFDSFTSEAAMDAAYPAGDYSIDATGPLGTFSEMVQLTPNAFPGQPFYTGSLLSALQGSDASQEITFTWNSPTGDAWFFSIDEVNGGEFFYADSIDFGAPTDTSVVVPADTLDPGKSYEAYLTFGATTPDTRDSFLTGSSFAAPGFGSETFATFTTAPLVPEPASVAAIGLAATGLIGVRRRRGHVTRA